MLISTLIYLLTSNAINIKRDKSILFSRIAIKSLLLVTFIVFNNLFLEGLKNGISIYSGLFNITLYSQSFNIFILLISAIILILTAFLPRKVFIAKYYSVYYSLFSKLIYNKNSISNKSSEQFSILEYPLIIIFIISGSIFLISTGDLISIFLSIELQSYGLYILSTIYRNSESATASGLTYFLLGGLSSCFILLGSALLYINSGTTNLDNIFIINDLNKVNNILMDNYLHLYTPYYFNLSMIVMIVGFLFKVSAAPFHFWSPDVYDGVPTVVTTFIAIIAKISIFAFMLELVFYTGLPYLDFSWKNILLLSSLFSLIIGSVLGLTQSRIKRLFAYSTINHVGFILLALSINNVESIQAYIFYIFQYTISNLNAFIILIVIGYSLYLYVYKEKQDDNLIDISNSPIQLISQIKGYFHINPYLALSLSISLFSFLGIPPLIGFFAKQMVLSAALDNGYTFMTLIAIFTSVIGGVYYLNVVKEMFFEKSQYLINPVINKSDLTQGIVLSKKSEEQVNSDITGYISLLKEEEQIQIEGKEPRVKKLKKITFNVNNIILTSGLTSTISIFTLLLMLFICVPGEWFNVVSVLTLVIFKS